MACERTVIVPFVIILLGSTCFAKDGDFNGELYSETYYDSRFDGAVTDSRFYNYFYFVDDRLKPYFGFHFTRDLSNNGAPLAIENAFIPTLGAEIVFLKKPYVSLFSEKRQIYRTESLNGQSRDDELRVGLIYYFKQYLLDKFFGETYGEWIQIDRVSSRSVFTTWLKLGYSISLAKKVSFDPFIEGFSRQSGNAGYGPLENEIRSGLRLNYQYGGVYIGGVVTHSLASNINPGAFDALLVLSSRVY